MKPTSPKMIFKSSLFYSAVFAHLSPYFFKLLTEKARWNKTYKAPTFTGVTPHVTILTILEAIRTSQDGMVDEVSGNILSELRNRLKFCGFSDESMQLLLEEMWNKVQYALKYSQKAAGKL